MMCKQITFVASQKWPWNFENNQYILQHKNPSDIHLSSTKELRNEETDHKITYLTVSILWKFLRNLSV